MTQGSTQTERSGCCGASSSSAGGQSKLEMLPIYHAPAPEAPCCGPPADPPSSPYERPGYRWCAFVERFIPTAAGPVPRVKTRLEGPDKWGTLRMRLGAGRSDYKVAPGLYAVGQPDEQAPVLVTANYKLSFDHLRKRLAGVAAWLLVLDTRGINVWCAAGKGTFDSEEIIRRVQSSNLSQVVSHRRLIVPQLGAAGVTAREVKKGCGFEVIWGPVRARDTQAFLMSGMQAEEAMRRVSFTFGERLTLVPVELSLLRKYLVWVLVAAWLLSGIGGHIFSFGAAWHRGLAAMGALAAGVLAGCVFVPALLPWIPGRAFSFKGAVMGLIVAVPVVLALSAGPHVALWSGLALVLGAGAVSSFVAMNFTGATPFTSPSGVEKEMRCAIPIQLAAAMLAVGLWIGSGFAG